MRYLITSALPYANGPIHIGHLAGAYLPADIFVRFLKKSGEDAIHICGTDENGVPITIAAEKEGVSPIVIADRYHKIIEKDFNDVYIKFDNFSRTTTEIHKIISQKFFMRLLEKGYIDKRESTQFYCPNCKRFLPDRYVEGTCPYCGYKSARGDQCEQCGRWLEPTLLINSHCKICGTTPIQKKTVHWYLRLDMFEEKLRKWLEGKNWKDNVMSELMKWLKEGLRPRPITRDIQWGVPVPLKEAKGKVLYVWFDAPIGYISSTIEWAEKMGNPELWKDFWMDKNTRLIHFIGKDNKVFHGIIWPATLMGYGEFILPDNIPSNEFLNLEGDKISTSRDWAIWIGEFARKFDPDYLRFYLTLIMPETKDSNFSYDDFYARTQAELIDNFGNFVNRTFGFIKNYRGGIVPHPGEMDNEDREILNAIGLTAEGIKKDILSFRFKKALRKFIGLSTAANRYFDTKAPWKTRKIDEKRTDTTLYISSALVDGLSDIGEIFVPGGSARIKKMLNLSPRKWDFIKYPELKGGESLSDVAPPYEKIDKEKIKIEKRRFGMEGKPEEKEKEYVTIDDFKKMGLKIGKIVEVTDVEHADKLYKLTVDLGEEKRTLIAGLKSIYTKEELEGRNIVVITNLQPATIRGIKSEGMLLAADSGEVISILSPDKDVAPGTEVR